MIINRIFGMPNHLTFKIKPIKELIERYYKKEQLWLDPFANNSQYGITNDLNPKFSTHFNLDFIDYLKLFNKCYGMFIDPPYSPTQIKLCYDDIGLPGSRIEGGFYSRTWKEALRIKPAIILQFGWNTNGQKKYYDMVELLIVNHGSMHNDTLVSVWKIKEGYRNGTITYSPQEVK